jgi:aminopeptidase N
MKKLFLVLAVMLTPLSGVLAQSAGSDSLNDPMYSFMGNGGYDALDYNINLHFAPDKKTLVGTTTMEAVATQDLSAFNLDFGSMTVSNVVVNDSSARFVQADPEMTISPSVALKKGEKFKVSIVYSGTPGTKLGAASNFGKWLISPAGLTVLAEPSLMFTWSPVNEIPSDKATFSLKLTSSQQDTAVANGEFIGRVENPDGTASSSYRIGTPTATYFVVMVVGNWKLEEGGKVGNTRVRHYFAPGTSDVMRQAVAETNNIIGFYSDKLIPYPFSEAGVLTSDNDLGFALETQSLVSLPTSFGQGEGLIDTTEIVAHEFAHQWFGALVTFKTHEDIFVHEGFAEYLGWVYTAERFKDRVGENYIANNIRGFYPNAVNGRYVQSLAKTRLVSSLKAQLGQRKLNQENTIKALELLFGTSLPTSARDAVLAQIPTDGFTKTQFADAIATLAFNQVIVPLRNLYEIMTLTGRSVGNLAPNWDVVTPPGKLKQGDDLFNFGVYARGATTVHALRLKIGDEAFWKLLRGYLEKYKFSNASNTDWLEFVQNTAGLEARASQERWLRDDVPPDFPELGLKATDFKLGADFK